jgi:polyphosphate kinase
MNQLEDTQMCEALVSASREGLPIDLVVRGFCCLRPGVAGQTETIRVRSIIGRFLEHSRIFYFGNGASDPRNGDFYIGSADWMERNLSWRVEVVTPVVVPALRQRLWEILDINLRDCRQAWMMNASGEYQRLEPGPEAQDAAVDGTHATLMHLTATAAHVTNGNMVVRELPVNQGSGLSSVNAWSNASVAVAISERKRN